MISRIPGFLVKSLKPTRLAPSLKNSSYIKLYRPKLYYSSTKDNGNNGFTLNLEKKINPNVEINTDENIIEAEVNGKKITYTLKDEVKGATLGDSDRYIMMFTCGPCGHKDTKTFTKKAYHTSVVIISCDNCGHNHLIADNLGWFRDTKVNVEDLVKEKGEEALRVTNTPKMQKILNSLKFVGIKHTATTESDNQTNLKKEVHDTEDGQPKKLA